MTARIIFLILIVSLLSNGCSPHVSEERALTPTGSPMTATLPAPVTPVASQTLLPPPPQPTVAPVEGTTSTQINVRAEPSTGSNILGILPANTKVQILVKDPGGNWFQISYPQGKNGKGWVTAKYVTTAKGIEVPVIGGDASNPNNGNVAIVQQQINVRSGPGTSFNSLGTLNAQDAVKLIGKDANGTWLQIQFSAGPDGKGWVNAAFVQAKGVENLPIIAEGGNVIGTGTPTSTPPTVTATVLPAWTDNDSKDNPAANVVFQPLGTHTLIYSGAVSTPQGDSEDWIRFIPYSVTVFASLECNGDNALAFRIWEGGQRTALTLSCGDRAKELNVKAESAYLIQIQASQSAAVLNYTRYTIKIDTDQ